MIEAKEARKLLTKVENRIVEFDYSMQKNTNNAQANTCRIAPALSAWQDRDPH